MAVISMITDAEVDDRADLAIRTLLGDCFAPEAGAPLDRRYFAYRPRYRWLIRDAGNLVAHAAVHDKEVTAAGISRPLAGVGDVCVRPSSRGRGLCRRLLDEVHRWAHARWLEDGSCPFALLFGDPGLYRALGYNLVHNVWVETQPGVARKSDAMVRPSGPILWPEKNVYLDGTFF